MVSRVLLQLQLQLLLLSSSSSLLPLSPSRLPHADRTGQNRQARRAASRLALALAECLAGCLAVGAAAVGDSVGIGVGEMGVFVFGERRSLGRLPFAALLFRQASMRVPKTRPPDRTGQDRTGQRKTGQDKTGQGWRRRRRRLQSMAGVGESCRDRRAAKAANQGQTQAVNSLRDARSRPRSAACSCSPCRLANEWCLYMAGARIHASIRITHTAQP